MNMIEINAIVESSLQKVWLCWTQPLHIMNWNFADDDWHCPSSSNDLNVGGEFHYQMEARDGSMNFDFWGRYEVVQHEKLLIAVLGDGRRLEVEFVQLEHGVQVTERFEPEQMNPEEMQRMGWQMILNRFAGYCEGVK
jgi:uncharacterized protein YndB with AHSA1/START domain